VQLGARREIHVIIDIHTHITFARVPEFSSGFGRQRFTVETLLRRMDREGIDRSVVLPIANPENVDMLGVAGNAECLEACARHADRLMPFCCVDPRNMLNTPDADLSQLLKIYRDLGCRGVGEECANLPIDDPRYANLFDHCGRVGMPILFHLTGREGGTYGVIDRLGLPGLERALRKFPRTIFIGHAPAFWSEIAADVRAKTRDGYPGGPVRKPGRLWRLLSKHRNLYGDLSAGSAFNAIHRDPEVGYRFLEKYRRKLFFGTDRFTSADEPVPPMLSWLRDTCAGGHISAGAFEDIMSRNFLRVVLRGAAWPGRRRSARKG